MSLYNFYRSTEWEHLISILRLERVNENGEVICEHCGKPIVKKYDCIGHHMVELTEENYMDARISLNPDNIMLVHHKCHNIIHDKLGMLQQKQVYLIYGSPLSGKTAWVKENMVAGDLIVDMDNIWECVSGQPRYVKPNRLKAAVFAVRDNLLESVKYRRGKWLNAYVIGGYPYQAERERLCEELGAREIYINTTKEECLQRLQEDTERDKTEWNKYIDIWWLQHNGGY